VFIQTHIFIQLYAFTLQSFFDIFTKCQKPSAPHYTENLWTTSFNPVPSICCVVCNYSTRLEMLTL